MQSNYRIGTLAEKIVAVNISRNGTITPICRQREANGRMVDLPIVQHERTRRVAQFEFVARVAHNHSGVVAIVPRNWEWYYSVGMIPLGQEPPFSEPADATDDGLANAIDQGLERLDVNEVWFRFADGKLTWKSGHVSGEAVINETYPELAVVLRLPPGNHGEISFASPLFTTADGEPASVLSVA